MEGLIPIRRAEPEDLDAALVLEQASPEAAHWTRDDYERVLRGEYLLWVAGARGEVRGFLVARQAADEFEILNLIVGAEWRRQKLGSRLLEHALGQARRAGARKALLEVRASNAGAIAFYEGRGFAQSGIRRDYYASPREDALIFWRDL